MAAERGVDLQGVIDALVADATARIDTAVADGRLDAERAAELKAALPDRVAEFVNRDRPRRDRRGGPPPEVEPAVPGGR